MINKSNILSSGAGIGLGVLALVLSLVFSSFKNDISAKMALDDSVTVSYFTVKNKEKLLATTLTLFGFEANNSHLTNDNDNLLSLSEDITVRIVAQAKVGDIQNTMLEIISANETKLIQVKEGSVINGLLIKSITDKYLVVEKNTAEHIIKLFHPKELNSTKTEHTNDTP